MSMMILNIIPNANDNTNIVKADSVFEDFKYEVNEGEVTITRYTKNDDSVLIPETIEGYPVTKIGERAFSFCDCKHIIMPDTVKSIGARAFEYCAFLEDIIIPDGVTSIEDNTFCFCNNLMSVKIPDSVTKIGNNAFTYCSYLYRIDIPDSVTSIGSDAFFLCRFLRSIKIPQGITKIEKDTFGLCSSLNNVEIPNTVTRIEKGAFSDCESLKSIVLPESVEEIEDGAFDKNRMINIIFPNRKEIKPLLAIDSEHYYKVCLVSDSYNEIQFVNKGENKLITERENCKYNVKIDNSWTNDVKVSEDAIYEINVI